MNEEKRAALAAFLADNSGSINDLEKQFWSRFADLFDLNGGGLDASAITSGTIPADRLPSYVDDVVEYANRAAFPVSGETGKIYLAQDTGATYRWTGSTYVAVGGGYVAIDTYANIVSNYPAASFTRRKAFMTDVGPSGSEFISNGSRWIPVNGRVLIDRLTLPCVKAPTFTGTANGAITLGTAVPVLFSKCFMYFPANSLNASHAAGFYYTEMSTTTAAKVYNNTYTPANGAYPTEPVSKTDFGAGVAVPGGAGVTSNVAFFISKIPAGLLGMYGKCVTHASLEVNNTAGAKFFLITLGGSTVCQEPVASTGGSRGYHVISNIGSQEVQRSGPRFDGQSSTQFYRTTIDTSADVAIAFYLTAPGASTDLIACSELSLFAEVAQ